MNCLEFRRLCLANPQHPGEEALRHEIECAQCARFYRELRLQEEALYQALSVPIPDGLADRILLRRRSRLNRDWPALWPPAIALALSLLLGLGLGLIFPRGMSPETLAAGVIAHVRDEPQALAAEQHVPMPQLIRAFERSGGELLASLAEASYAGRCPLPGGGYGEHIVLKTPQGKVTLILMPGKPANGGLRLFKDGLSVSMLPAGQGSLALVAESDELVRTTQAAIDRAVRWQSSRT
jgi:Protein of unknown function (DUF3379)